MVTPEKVRSYILENMHCDHVAVDGDGAHFEAVIVSPDFRGKTRIQQHQVVYRALGDRMRQEIHALSMKTYTPEEWASR
ncbi:MAG: BolA/IbaG family iron-sulfur metabolism protein [Burkholderiales bacterium]|jgi:acid stress-induced BolA-like protein IbaG/YrbA|nr:BolA/IbaG family iron-sulfur metabolism protein [Burkholderiales bacterium]